MLGHIAQSVGAALPGSGAATAIISQIMAVNLNSTSVSVPADAKFAFVELLGAGGYNGSSSTNLYSGGGGGSDAIWEVQEGQVVAFDLRMPIDNTAPDPVSSSATYPSKSLTVESGLRSTSSNSGGGAGKYPGSGASSSAPGKGGGRLAGAVGSSGDARITPGHGAGRGGLGTQGLCGGRPIGVVTFFRNQDAALAFANALYGGNWQP